MVVAVRAELVGFFVLREVFAECFATLLADEGHLDRLAQRMVLRFGVAFWTLWLQHQFNATTVSPPSPSLCLVTAPAVETIVS